jgi:hypothetical protein
VPAPSAAASTGSTGSTGSAPASPGETVVRVDPDQPGLAHGRWEAPAWAFYVTAGVAVLGGLTWLAVSLRTRRSGS